MKAEINNDIRQLAEDFIRRYVAMGFDDADLILDVAFDYLEDQCDFEVLEPYLIQLIRELMAEHCKAQKDWPAETDCDRLDFAFLTLEEDYDIVARHNFTCCQTCGHTEIWEEIRQAQQRGPVQGYTFYHHQDTEGAVDSGTLYLAYGAVDKDKDAARDVALRIVQVLQDAGLTATWNGDLRQRILVKLNWQKRRVC